MPTAYSIAQRTPALNGLFAGLACAVALALTAGPALAQAADLERVEISGKVFEAPTRFDVVESCEGIEQQLQAALEPAWLRNKMVADRVQVQFVMDGGAITAVKAHGMTYPMARAVRQAVSRLQCGHRQTTAAIYRFRVDFIDPYSEPARRSDAQTASADQPVGFRIALASHLSDAKSP